MRGDKHEAHKWSEKNVSVLDADDWEVAFIGGLAGGWGFGGSIFKFRFRSPSLSQYLKFWFVGGGAGGGLFGGYDLEDTDPIIEHDCSRIDWAKLSRAIPEPFSASNLCNAIGRVSLMSVATPGKVGFGYTLLILTAQYIGPNRRGYLFDQFHLGGLGPGTGGAALGVNWGKWQFVGVPSKTGISMNNWTSPVCR